MQTSSLKDTDMRAVHRGPPRRLAPPTHAAAFPTCATNALAQVEKAVLTTAVSGSPSQKVSRLRDLQSCVDLELFCLGPDRKAARLNPIEQLTLLDILCSFFQEISEKDPKNRYAYFDTIFLGREGESVPHEARISVLVDLCALAVQYPGCEGLLTDVATWLQKVGLVKPYARQIVTRIVEDFCCFKDVNGSAETVDLSPNLHHHLLPWAQTVPLMLPYVLGLSMVEYADYAVPPYPLLETLAEWMCTQPKAIVKPLKETGKSGRLTKLVEEALCKLTFVCAVVAPFMQISAAKTGYGSALFSRVHSGVLHVMLVARDVGDSAKLTVLTDANFMQALAKLNDRLTDPMLTVALDRLAQALQVALAAKSFDGSREKIKKKYAELGFPKHQLLEYSFEHALDK